MSRDSVMEMKKRHKSDRWRDAAFIGLAVVITALLLGSVTSKAKGSSKTDTNWSVKLQDSSAHDIH
jgi:hypothetical protein